MCLCYIISYIQLLFVFFIKSHRLSLDIKSWYQGSKSNIIINSGAGNIILHQQINSNCHFFVIFFQSFFLYWYHIQITCKYFRFLYFQDNKSTIFSSKHYKINTTLIVQQLILKNLGFDFKIYSVYSYCMVTVRSSNNCAVQL